MSCCQSVNRKEFLTQKLTNFRAFLEPHCVTDELKTRFNEFKDLDSVMPYLLQCVAMSRLGTLDTAVESFLATFPAESIDEPFKVKLRRYICMFVDVLTS